MIYSKNTVILRAIFPALLILLAPKPSLAQDFLPKATQAAIEKELTIEDIKVKKDKLLKEIDLIKNSKLSEKNLAFKGQIILERIVFALNEQKIALENKQQATNIKEEVLSSYNEKVANLSGSFLEFEKLRNDSLESSSRKIQAENDYKIAQRALERAKDQFEDKERNLRKVKEESADTPSKKNIEAASLELRLAKETYILSQLKFETAKIVKEETIEIVKEQEEILNSISDAINFAKEDYQQVLNNLDSKEKKTRKKLSKVEEEIAKTQSGTDTKEATEKQRLALASTRLSLTFYSRSLDIIEQKRDIWKKRYDIRKGLIDLSLQKKWREEAIKTLEDLERIQSLDESALSDLRKQAEQIEESKTLNTERTNLPPIDNIIINKAFNAHQELQDEKSSYRLLLKKFSQDIDKQVTNTPISERISSLWASVSSIWQYEITSFDDHPITVSKVIFALLLFFIGIFIAKRISRQFSQRILPKLSITRGSAAALESLIFYALVLIFTLISLRLINVPLTVFTVIGGALAIGFGFGSQNIVNNFISGLILLVEQPIRVGDLVETQGLTGLVKRIGLRSTVVRTGSNIDIIVPNSSFLEKDVINWTLSSDLVRLFVSVGVTYDTDEKKATELLHQVAKDNQSVLDRPKHLVWLTEFGDNAIILQLHFWSKVKDLTEKQTIESDIRYQIREIYRQNKIVIAFPQRDVHLDSVKPLEVKMVNS